MSTCPEPYSGPLRGIGVFRGYSLIGLDALASAAYGPEAMLTVLLPLGTRASENAFFLAAPLIAYLLTLVIGYAVALGFRPAGGAYAYVKAKMGPGAADLIASALILDYLLVIAIGLAAAFANLESAAPALRSLRLPIELAALGGLILLHLVGVRKVGAWARVPTLLFLLTMGYALATALLASSTHDPLAISASMTGPTSAAKSATETPAILPMFAMVLLLVRAFANGATAATGIEAVLDAKEEFRPPQSNVALITLFSLAGTLIVLLIAISLVCAKYALVAQPTNSAHYESVLSMVVAAGVGRGPFYWATLASIVAILLFSANTGLTDFPRLCARLAGEGKLPTQFCCEEEHVPRAGIILSGVAAGAILLLFGGVTNQLIPLFAIGAFGAFSVTMAAVLRDENAARRSHLRVVVLIATIVSGLVFATISVARFTEGAWLGLLILVGGWLLFSRKRNAPHALESAGTLKG